MIQSLTNGCSKSQADAGSGVGTVAANGMEVVAGILLEKGMGMKAGRFVTFLREVELSVVIAKLLSSAWTLVRRQELKSLSLVVLPKGRPADTLVVVSKARWVRWRWWQLELRDG